jgi:hypothetical protein
MRIIPVNNVSSIGDRDRRDWAREQWRDYSKRKVNKKSLDIRDKNMIYLENGSNRTK